MASISPPLHKPLYKNRCDNNRFFTKLNSADSDEKSARPSFISHQSQRRDSGNGTPPLLSSAGVTEKFKEAPARTCDEAPQRCA